MLLLGRLLEAVSDSLAQSGKFTVAAQSTIRTWFQLGLLSISSLALGRYATYSIFVHNSLSLAL
jgi:hypothetical protein